MFRTRIKFCGLRRPGDVATAVALGVDAIGLILVPGSPRHVTLDTAAKLRAGLPPLVGSVVLFKDADAGFVQEAIDAVRPDLLQFHGNEDAAFCASFNTPYVKALAMGGRLSLRAEARRYASASALLLDSHVPGGMGGRGETFAWTPLPKVARPLWLAGGLTAGNVGNGIKALRPFAVDVSSGIEARPGVKDADKMRAFVAAVRRADQKLK
ncbi:phosphoribosylanthranilate isomerase [Solimonas terrae]|uniref:N-(5'-phosphoribosyl)anthranilate isomerase n=1 Tax=Solimonas terrae TaxID=1396819 RepID=A0A6M2BVD6_9GAMM|nr:phosphoribosylanthranilate isomerase [Solimonas terrae]NGY06215.1 phosphoribosylanthranilate isomerase [Solimonas terrae]